MYGIPRERRHRVRPDRRVSRRHHRPDGRRRAADRRRPRQARPYLVADRSSADLRRRQLRRRYRDARDRRASGCFVHHDDADRGSSPTTRSPSARWPRRRRGAGRSRASRTTSRRSSRRCPSLPDHGRRASHTGVVASYTLNDRAVARARKLIDAHQYVLDSDWGDAPAERRGREPVPRLAHLGGIRRVAPRPDRRRDRRDQGAATASSTATSGGSIGRASSPASYRAAEWRHKEIELAAHDLLQHLDRTSA